MPDDTTMSRRREKLSPIAPRGLRPSNGARGTSRRGALIPNRDDPEVPTAASRLLPNSSGLSQREQDSPGESPDERIIPVPLPSPTETGGRTPTRWISSDDSAGTGRIEKRVVHYSSRHSRHGHAARAGRRKAHGRRVPLDQNTVVAPGDRHRKRMRLGHRGILPSRAVRAGTYLRGLAPRPAIRRSRRRHVRHQPRCFRQPRRPDARRRARGDLPSRRAGAQGHRHAGPASLFHTHSARKCVPARRPWAGHPGPRGGAGPVEPEKASGGEIPFMPARVVLQDFTGVPCVVDLAAMRDAMAAWGATRADQPGRAL